MSRPTDEHILGDIGSTFIKMAAIGGDGQLRARTKVPTVHDDISGAVARAHQALTTTVGWEPEQPRSLSSSAGGGLRVMVVGLERVLTVEAGRRTSATAGARIVAAYAVNELHRETLASMTVSRPDVVLLTGGTDGGNESGIEQGARYLSRLAPRLPVIVAGNREARERVGAILGGEREVRFVPNVMPRVGELSAGPARQAIRELFIDSVIGHGRYASAASIANDVRMPTPAAVLTAAEVVSGLAAARPELTRPIVVDVGGATTDVHSVMSGAPDGRGYAMSGLPDQVVTRTVEGDLGLRESAVALLDVAESEGLADQLTDDERADLRVAATMRSSSRDFVPADDAQRRYDEVLATWATAIALHRHAGVLKTSLTAGGASLVRTGRDLRDATCLVITGGVFEHSACAESIAAAGLRVAHGQGALVPGSLPIVRDRLYALWAVGLLQSHSAGAASRLAATTLSEATRA